MPKVQEEFIEERKYQKISWSRDL